MKLGNSQFFAVQTFIKNCSNSLSMLVESSHQRLRIGIVKPIGKPFKLAAICRQSGLCKKRGGVVLLFRAIFR